MKRLAAALDLARASRSRIAKEQALAGAFRAIVADAEAPDAEPGLALATAARLASGRTLPVGDGRTLGVGWAIVMDVAVELTGFSADIVRACSRRTGDLGEAFGLLVRRAPGEDARPGAALVDVARALDRLASTGSRAAKLAIVRDLFARATWLETKYLAKALLLSLRVGAQEGVVEAAIGRAFERDAEAVRRAMALVGDPGVVAVLASGGRLQDARFAIGRPVAYMLATPLETISTPPDPATLVVEDKIDGIRAQVHKRGTDVAIFARGLERVTSAFPEVADAFRLARGDVALDGELVALAESGRPRPFQTLQSRLNRTSPTAAMVAATPVTFVAYDLLADDEGSCLDLPWSERRARLEAFARDRGPDRSFALHPCAPLGAAPPALDAAIDEAFTQARARGHEGVVLKRTDAVYEAGRRGSAWIKVKRAFATLDVVVTAAEEGHGKRAGVLSDYTFAVWREGELVNVGKAYSGLTDVEIEAMTRRFEASTVQRFGGVRIVRPEVVLEVGFDGLQRSKRHKSGFALRFSRILRIRDDKRPEDADQLSAVEALLAAQVESGHREESPPEAAATPSRPRKTRKARDAPPASQLSLFGEQEREPDGRSRS